MTKSFFFGAATLSMLLAHTANAVLVVDPPMAITHQVKVQVIQVSEDDGSNTATFFGTPSQQALIEAAVDTIWAQAGIDIEFLPTVNAYNSTFAHTGTTSPRPTSDLTTIIDNAALAGGILNPDPSVINMFFVDVVPGFSFTSENTANGLARVGGNGITQFVGDNLLTFENGRDVIASVVAHEIGHNLGLRHLPSGSANLMGESNRTSEQLTPDQIAAIFQTTARNDALAFIPSGGTGFPQAVPEPSHYALMLGALAIAVQVVRRRKSA